MTAGQRSVRILIALAILLAIVAAWTTAGGEPTTLEALACQVSGRVEVGPACVPPTLAAVVLALAGFIDVLWLIQTLLARPSRPD